MPINFAVKLAATIAVEAVAIGLQASQRTKGPRLDELTVTVSDYGTPLPRFLGARKFACPLFHAEDLKEVQTDTKVKGGGKQTTYHYLGTFAAAISDCEIDKVLKIWFDDTLVYDMTGTGPFSLLPLIVGAITGDGPTDISQYMRIYTGTETQDPDPRYASWCEDRYGPNSAPAYRGVSYLFFEELPLDNFGNRIPQISVLATASAGAGYPWETDLSPAGLGATSQFSPDGTRLYAIGGSSFQVWDVPTRTLLSSETVTSGISYAYAITPSGIYGVNISGDAVFQIGLDGGFTQIGTTPGGWSGAFYAGGEVIFIPSTFVGMDYGFLGTGTISAVPTNFYPTFYFTNEAGAAIALGTTSGTHLAIAEVPGSATIIDTSAYGTSGAAYGFDNGTNYVVRQGGYLFLIDRNTHAIVSAVSEGSPASYPAATYTAIAPGSTTFWEDNVQYDATDLSVIRTVNIGDWAVTGVTEHSGQTYSSVLNALVSFANDPGIIWRYLDRAGNNGVTLGQIVSAMCDAAALVDRDTSLLTQLVLGYSWTRGDIKSQMEPILDIYDVDARPNDFTIEFLPRGNAAGASILTENFAKNGDSPRYKVSEGQDTDLPKILRVNFADTGFDQQTNNILSPLPVTSVDSQRDAVIDLTTYADTQDGAQQKADRYMRRQWNGKDTVELSLTARYLDMEPGDVATLWLDTIPWTARLERQTLVGSRLDCTFRRDESDVANLNALTTGPSMEAREPSTIQIPAPVRGFVVDVPLRADSDDDVRPLLYAGAGSYADLTYPGAAIYQASGTTLVYDQLFAIVSSGSDWAVCTSALGDANANLWDRGNTLDVILESGMLTSVTEADIDADPNLNLVLVGQPGNWEYLNFTTATLNGDGSYTLSGFKRGRRGTEWACANHSSGDVLIFAETLTPEEMGVDEVGGNESFKCQSVGRAIDAATPIDLEPFAGNSLKPYAPASLTWTYDGTDLQGRIIRRTRVGGSWNGSTISLGESSEEYEVDIYNGSTFKRTITVSGTNTFTYTSAMAAADGITLPALPTSEVYQISATVGRGFALAA